MAEELIPQEGSRASQPLPAASAEEWQRIETAYREIQRRDGQAEYRTWRLERFTKVLLGVLVVLVGVIVWQWLDHRKVQEFVQVVQIDEQGKLLQVGIPQDLLAYTPPDGVWINMLGEWVRRIRWRGTDAVLMRAQWAWVYRHTCGQARRLLQSLEERESPFKPQKKLTAIELRSITKTPVPESYQVLWEEATTEPSSPAVKRTLWTGTFSVGRIQLPTLADALDNRLGLCVTAFDLSPQPEGR